MCMYIYIYIYIYIHACTCPYSSHLSPCGIFRACRACCGHVVQPEPGWPSEFLRALQGLEAAIVPGRKNLQTLQVISLSQEPAEEDGTLQFFILDKQETLFLMAPEDLRRALPPFSYSENTHQVLEITIRPTERIGADAHLVHFKVLETLTDDVFHDLMDIWIQKTWGPV